MTHKILHNHYDIKEIFYTTLIFPFFRLSKAPENAEDFEKRRSQAAIRAQAKKELEKEQQIQAEVKKLQDTYGEKPVIICNRACLL